MPNRHPFLRSTLVAVALTFAGTTLWSPPAVAGGRSRLTKGGSKGPGAAVGRFWKCIRGKRCVARKVFRSKALKEWARSKQKLQQIKILRSALVSSLPARYQAKLQRRWSRYAPKLKTAGYSSAALARLGHGRSIVTLKPSVALALISLKMERRGRVRTEHLFLVLWKIKRRWYVTHVEDSPGSIARFLIKHKP